MSVVLIGVFAIFCIAHSSPVKLDNMLEYVGISAAARYRTPSQTTACISTAVG